MPPDKLPAGRTAAGGVDLRTRRAIVLAAAIYWCAWVTVTHWPKIEVPMFSGWRWDKVAHFGGYTILAFLLSLVAAVVWRGGMQITRRDALGVWLVISVGGILDELTQPLFGRSFEWGDYAADLLGGLLGIALAAALLAFLRTRQRLAA